MKPNNNNIKQKNNKILNTFFRRRNLKKETRKRYTSSLNIYSEVQNLTLEELLLEAETEEDNNIPLKRRSLKQRFLDYKYVLEETKSSTTVKAYINDVRSFYNEFEIQLPKKQRIKTPNEDSYKIILTKNELRKVLDSVSNKKYKALILFMLSSGTGLSETLSITIEDFIEATKDYHNEINIINVLSILENKNNVIPTFNIVRIKRDRPYFTFCSPEAVDYIIIYLKERLFKKGYINSNEQLFETSTSSVSTRFRYLNDINNLGKNERQTHRKFHSHGLRKFFATNMVEAGMSDMYVDALEGRKFSSVHSAYMKLRPEKVKPIYSQYVGVVTIYDDVHYRDIDSKEYEELKHLREKNKNFEAFKREQEQKINEIEMLLASIER